MHIDPLVTLLAAACLAASGSALAQHTGTPSKRPAPLVQQAPQPQTAPATPSGDTHVHRALQGWGRGMDKAGAALGKLPKPDGRWPGTASSRQPSPSPSHEGP